MSSAHLGSTVVVAPKRPRKAGKRPDRSPAWVAYFKASQAAVRAFAAAAACKVPGVTTALEAQGWRYVQQAERISERMRAQ